MTILLEPCPVAKFCFLHEALDYCLFGKIPMATFPPLRGNPYHDRDVQTLLVARSVFDMADWRYELDPGSGIEWIEPRSEPSRTPVFAPEAKSEVSRIKAELFLTLSRGQLKARGRKYPGQVHFPDISDSDEITGPLQDAQFECIPSEFWCAETIRWNESLAEGIARAVYFHIQVDTETLLSLSPVEPVAPFEHVRLYRGQLILDEYVQDGRNTGSRRGPKPKYDRAAIEDEALRRLFRAQPGKSRDDFASDIRVWYEKKFGKPAPAVSTINGYVERIYNLFVEASQ